MQYTYAFLWVEVNYWMWIHSAIFFQVVEIEDLDEESDVDGQQSNSSPIVPTASSDHRPKQSHLLPKKRKQLNKHLSQHHAAASRSSASDGEA